MYMRAIQVQGRDGREHRFLIPEAALLPLPRHNSSTSALRLVLPVLGAESFAAAFFSNSRDASNSVLSWLGPEAWLQLEQTSAASRTAVLRSNCCWSSLVLAGHSLRFPPERRKTAYVRHRRAVWRVTKAFQDLRRFARFPGSVFNPGASLADTFRAEQRSGVVLPDEARASFSVFDGQARSAWLRSEGVIGGFKLLSLDESVDIMQGEACFQGVMGLSEFVPLADRRNNNEWLAAAVDGGRICVIKPLSRPKVVASSWSCYLRVQ